jgi:hypothetical protein
MSKRAYKKSWTDLSRISSKYYVDENGCWIWTAGKYRAGYGKFSINWKNMNAHRASYIIHKGPFDYSKLVLHKCDVKLCVNPDHLYIGDKSRNLKDAYERGQAVPWNRDVKSCKQGHPFDHANTITTSDGRRSCSQCRKIKSKKNNQKIKMMRSHCVNGHEFSRDNNQFKSNGYRKCILCSYKKGKT